MTHPPSATQARMPNRDYDTSLEQLLVRGYVILDRLAPEEILTRIEAELSPWFSATPACRGDFYGWHTTRINAIPFKAPTSHALLLHPRILALMDAVLAPHCDWYQLNLSQAIRLHPGERQQIPHRDDDMWPCAKRHEYMINVLWAISDFTAQNGATLLWPKDTPQSDGTTLPHASDAMAAVMPRGSALIYLGSTLHCGGANRSASPRTGLVFSYSLGWLKQYENAFLTYPPSIARTLPPPVIQLLGYRLHRPNLGHYEGQDPAVALHSDSRTLGMVDGLPPAIAEQLREYYAPIHKR